jgi:formylglycine-generating enzyme required for sulfatase activity
MREEVPSKYIGANRPVDEVLEADSNKFIKTLNKLTGMNFSIPTEEQWEFAARGGVYSKGYKLSGGNEPSELFGKNEVEDGYQSITYDVGIFKSNELGLYDMNSNVSEWCIKDINRNTLVLKGGVLGYEGGLIWDACSIAEEIRETADSYTPNKGIRIVLNI